MLELNSEGGIWKKLERQGEYLYGVQVRMERRTKYWGRKKVGTMN